MCQPAQAPTGNFRIRLLQVKPSAIAATVKTAWNIPLSRSDTGHLVSLTLGAKRHSEPRTTQMLIVGAPAFEPRSHADCGATPPITSMVAQSFIGTVSTYNSIQSSGSDWRFGKTNQNRLGT